MEISTLDKPCETLIRQVALAGGNPDEIPQTSRFSNLNEPFNYKKLARYDC